MHPLSVVFIAALISECYGHIGGGSVSLQETSSRMYCGRTLARTLAILCYDAPSEHKRSESGSMYNAVLSPYYKDQATQVDWPWMTTQRARALGLSSRGKRDFVVSECCDKPCSINELLSYC
ncbi:bombyxin A-2 homolog [Pieris brassicae]|uniref:Insulin-like domain-containing protein n=1 Tax=Pieris brassicae TaxID=7116 RepID=A0A9P0XHG4_PIEBR|nr:bombyxin A-2 homolog [Pieris brassicae]CAH4036592.1 unnamed protein product [Pieris brassicae]